jgi:phage repressor protein C with HTH and peptisase S24 domain/transcriptional regulator with XRE-family HTH domain
MDIKQLRVRALRRLIGQNPLKEFAEKHDLDASYLSQILNGHRGMGEKAAAKMAAKIGVAESILVSPVFASEDESEDADSLPDPASGSDVKTSAAGLVLDMLKGKNLRPDQLSRIEQAVSDTIEDKPTAPADNVITADFSRRPIVGDEIRIAHYDVQGAMGGGKVVHDFPEMFRDVTVSQQHLRELGVTYKDPAHLKLITGAGQSMEPTIKDKDPLIADASIREFVGDGIYALSWHGHFYIKRLQVADAEHFEMISDNPQHKDRIVRIDETFIQAKIQLVWNAKRL